MKTIIAFLVFFVMFTGCNRDVKNENPKTNDEFSAKLDEFPQPVGGLKELMKKIEYPEEAKEKGIEGKVILKVFTDESGNVVKTEVLKSLGYGCDKAAVQAVKRTKFTPGIKNGKAVKSYFIIPVLFKLN